MPGFQFIHVETYSRATPKKATGKKGKHSLRTIIAEANREPDACTHVTAPLPPEIVLGPPLKELEAEIHQNAESAVDARGHKLRRDATVLLAGVASYPVAWSEVDEAAVAEWERRTVAFLRREYGNALRAVVRHRDEQYPHLHFYAAPWIDSETKRLNAKALHRGYRAAEGKKGPEANAAYKAAMSAFQDEYHRDVGLPCGLARLGPRRRRLSRADWQREKSQAAAAAEAARQAERIRREAEQQAETVRMRAEADARQRKATLERQLSEGVEKAKEYLRMEQARLVAEEKQLVEDRHQLELERVALAEERLSVAALAEAYRQITEPLRAFAGEVSRWIHDFGRWIKPSGAAAQGLEAAVEIVRRVDAADAEIERQRQAGYWRPYTKSC